MSAPNQGRQSPEPENQSDAQAGHNASPNDQGAGPKGDNNSAEESKEQLKGLESNPKGPLEDAKEQKTMKGNGNPDLGGK
jgi:hypothetical protein